jgi:hypothetical protein
MRYNPSAGRQAPGRILHYYLGEKYVKRSCKEKFCGSFHITGTQGAPKETGWKTNRPPDKKIIIKNCRIRLSGSFFVRLRHQAAREL